MCLFQFWFSQWIYPLLELLGHRIVFSFFGGSDGKEFAFSAGELGSIPKSERSPGEGNGYQFQYSFLENSIFFPGSLQSMGSQRIRHDGAIFHFMVVLFLLFKRISILLSIVTVSICIPTNSARRFPSLHTLSGFIVYGFWGDGHCDQCKVIPNYSF